MKPTKIKKAAPPPAAKKSPTEIIRLSKSGLARAIGIHRNTVQRYLDMPGAPKPSNGTFDIAQVREFLAAKGSDSALLRTWRIEEIRLRCERLILERDRAREEYMLRSEIAATLEPLIAELRNLLRQKFVLDLALQYQGKGTIEIQEMNDAGLNEVIRRFRSGK